VPCQHLEADTNPVGAAGAVRQPRLRCVRQTAFAAVVTSGVSHSYCAMTGSGIDCCAMSASLSRHKPCGSCGSCATAAIAVCQADRFRCRRDLRRLPQLLRHGRVWDRLLRHGRVWDGHVAPCQHLEVDTNPAGAVCHIFKSTQTLWELLELCDSRDGGVSGRPLSLRS